MYCMWKIISNSVRVTRHTFVHSENRYHCTKCNKTYFQKSGLEQHLTKRYKGIGPLQCNLCKKSYFTKRALDKRMQDHKAKYSQLVLSWFGNK